MKVTSVAVFLFSINTVNCQLEWIKISNSASSTPIKRRDAAIGYDKSRDQLVLFGGRSTTPLSDTWLFNISAGAWIEVNTSKQPPARFSMVFGVSGDYFYVTTGEGAYRKFFNDIWRFSFTTESWEELPTLNTPGGNSLNNSVPDNNLAYIPEGRYGSAGGIFDGGTRVYVNQGFSSRRHFDTIYYDLLKQEWFLAYCMEGDCNPYNPSYPHARCLHSGTVISDYELVIFGGCLTGGETGGPCPSGDTWLFNAKTLQWKSYSACPSPKVYSSMAMLPPFDDLRRVVLYGGEEELPQVITTTESSADEVAIFDPDSGTWRRVITLQKMGVPAKRASASMATTASGVIIFGGISDDKNKLLNDLWLLYGDSKKADSAESIYCPQRFISTIMLHGIFMATGWGFFIVWGAYIARYFNSSGRVWYVMHITFQVFGLTLSIAGFVFAVLSVQSDHFKLTHGLIGLVVMTLGILQPINTIIKPQRPVEGQSKSRKRRVWEFIHHFGGRTAICLALVNLSLGVLVSNTHTINWALWFVYLGLIILVVIITEYVRECQTPLADKRYSSRNWISSDDYRRDLEMTEIKMDSSFDIKYQK